MTSVDTEILKRNFLKDGVFNDYLWDTFVTSVRDVAVEAIDTRDGEDNGDAIFNATMADIYNLRTQLNRFGSALINFGTEYTIPEIVKAANSGSKKTKSEMPPITPKIPAPSSASSSSTPKRSPTPPPPMDGPIPGSWPHMEEKKEVKERSKGKKKDEAFLFRAVSTRPDFVLMDGGSLIEKVQRAHSITPPRGSALVYATDGIDVQFGYVTGNLLYVPFRQNFAVEYYSITFPLSFEGELWTRESLFPIGDALHANRGASRRTAFGDMPFTTRSRLCLMPPGVYSYDIASRVWIKVEDGSGRFVLDDESSEDYHSAEESGE